MAARSNPNWAKDLERNLKADLPRVMQTAMLKVESEAKRVIYLGHPEHLNRITGTLGRSITTEVTSEGDIISAATGTNIVYAPIHEFGANIAHPGGRVLMIPARPYLTPSFAAKKTEVKNDLKEGIRRIIEATK